MTRCCNRNCREGRDCPRERDPMQSPAVIACALVLAVIAVCAVLQRLGLPMEWPF